MNPPPLAPPPRIDSPISLFLLMLLVIFSGESLIMFAILPQFFGGEEGIAANLLDACLLTLLASPILWFCIVRPLRDAVLTIHEQTAQLLAAQKELGRNEKLAILGQLAGSVGHELRNPLGVMNNAVYFLDMVQPDADETVKEYLGIIKNEIDNAQWIITDLLDFARTSPPRAEAVAVGELIGGSLRRCAVPENIEVRTELPATLPKAWVDSQQLRQVFQNLINNAVQAMPAGGLLHFDAEIQQEMTKTDSGAGFVAIRLADTGEGITPDNLKRLFQPLFTTRTKGIGLGLVVCRNLVEANGGGIEVQSTPEQGTTFTVRLPIERG